MKIQTRKKELYINGLLWGAIAFAMGIATTLLTLPKDLSFNNIPSWKVATWVWLNAHQIPVAEEAVTGSPLSMQNLSFIDPNPELHMLRVVPIFLSAMAGLLVVNTMNGARNDSELLEYVVVAAGGYVLAGLSAIVASEAQPGVIFIVGLMAILGAAAYFGSYIANSLPIPVFAVTSIGGLVGIGLFVMLGISVVSAVAIPLAKYAIVGAFGAAVALWVSKNLDF